MYYIYTHILERLFFKEIIIIKQRYKRNIRKY